MTNKWMTSGASRLKANLNRSFGARRNQKQKAASSATCVVTNPLPSGALATKGAAMTSSSLSRNKIFNEEGIKRGNRLIPSQSKEPPDMKNTTNNNMKTQVAVFENAMNGQQQNHHPYTPEERAPSHFFSNSYEQSSSAAAVAGTRTRMPAVLEMRHDQNFNGAGAGRNRQEKLMHMRNMRGGAHPGNAAAVALAHRRMVSSNMALGNGQRLPPPVPSGPIIVGVGGAGVGISNKHESDDATAFRTESIDHIIAFQEAQALREQELEQLRQLEFIRAVNQRQRRIKEEMMLAEQQHQLRRRQFYHPSTLGAVETSGSISDEELMNRQARLLQLQFMATDELARAGSTLSGDEPSMSQLQGGFQRGIGDCTVRSGGLIKTPHLAHASSESFAPVVENFDFVQPPRYYMPPSTLTSRSNSGGQTSTAPPPPLRFWNNGVEVDIRGEPLVSSSSLSRLNSSNSATSTAATRTSATTSSSSPPVVNIISQFSKLVMSCVPELNSAISNLLSEVMQVRGFPSDPLIVHSKFPGFVGSTLLELKSLGERSKDEDDLHKRIRNCIAAIEPYKSKNELGESSVYAQIRAIVEEGTERASKLILNDPSEKRARKKKEMEMKRKPSDDKEGDSKKSKKRKRESSLSSSDTIDILGMYKNHKYKVEEEVEVNDLQTLMAVSTKELSETSLPLSSDEGTSNVKEVENEKKDSSPSKSTTEPKEKGTSQPQVKKNRISGPSPPDSSSSEHPQAKSKSNVEEGPHSSLLRQIFGNVNGGGDSDSGDTTSCSTNSNAAANQKKIDDNSGHLSVANVLLGLGR